MTKVLVVTPNYADLFTGDAHSSHMDCAMAWTRVGLQFDWLMPRRMFIHLARNRACRIALEGDYSHLFFLDDDAIIEPEVLLTYLRHQKDVIVTPYFDRMAPHGIPIWLNGHRMDVEDLDHGLVEVEAGGTHAMLIHTPVLRRFPATPPWFVMPLDGTEDVPFCSRVRQYGGTVWCDTDARAGHVGSPPIITEHHRRRSLVTP